jgi:hypothetical protein
VGAPIRGPPAGLPRRHAARATGDSRAEAAALIAVAAARRARGEYLLGADSARTALALADKAADPVLAARAHNVLGLIESSRGEPAAALRHALLEQALFERAGDRRGLSQAYNNVAMSRSTRRRRSPTASARTAAPPCTRRPRRRDPGAYLA